jgi:toxin ParE1/3/4
MPRLKITTQAGNDLCGIVKYIAKDSPANAEKFAIKILEKCKRIADQPQTLGRLREEYGTGLRGSLCRPYLIFYHELDDRVEILHIIHSSRDIKNTLEQRKAP